MTVTYSTPKTWSVGELVTAALFNSHLRDNMDYAITPPRAVINLNLGADLTFTQTTYAAALDTTNLRMTLTLQKTADVYVAFLVTIINSVPTTVHWDISDNGARIGADDGLCSVTPTTAAQRMAVPVWHLFQGLAAGVHNFDLWGRNNAASTTTIYAGAGTAAGDVHPHAMAICNG